MILAEKISGGGKSQIGLPLLINRCSLCLLARVSPSLFFSYHKSLQICFRSRNVYSASRAHIRSPAELLQKRIRFFFNRIGNDFAKHRRKLKSMATITCSNY